MNKYDGKNLKVRQPPPQRNPPPMSNTFSEIL